MLLRFDKGTDTAADASGLPGENRVEFPFRHDGKQCRVQWGGFWCGVFLLISFFFVRWGFFHVFCRTCRAIAGHAWLILTA